MNYVGIDYHKRYSVATVMNEQGEVLAQQRLANRLEDFRTFLAPFGRVKAAVEATRGWPVPVDILELLGHEVVLANPYLVKAIARHKFGRTDGIDSWTLAKLLQLDWLPQAYLRDRTNRDQQLILRNRCFFVRNRTQLKNRIHDLIDRQAEPIREYTRTFSDLFGKKGLSWLRSLQLDGPGQTVLTQLLTMYDAASGRIQESDTLVAELYKADANCQLIGTVPGFGTFFAVLSNVEIGEISRFPSSSAFCNYAGLVPWTESSGGKTWHGPIVRQSNRWLRWAFIEAAIPAARADDGLRQYYEHYRRTKGPKTAKVALGRRLGCIVYRVLSQQAPYYERPPRLSLYRPVG